MQGELITPTRGVLDCYDMDDFVHAEMAPGSTLIKTAQTNSGATMPAGSFSGRFVTWSHIILSQTPGAGSPGTTVRLVLWQAYHPYWGRKAAPRKPQKGPGPKLPATLLKNHVVDLHFNDRLSKVAAAKDPVWHTQDVLALLLLLLKVRTWHAHRPSKAVTGRIGTTMCQTL
jgi:hypothetical protein